MVTPDTVMTLYPHVYKKLSYDPVRDFAPVTTLATVPMGLMVGPLVPDTVKTLADFIAWFKAHPGAASYGTSGAGSTLHFTGVMLARAGKFEFTHVPYRGANLTAQDAAAGQIAACVNVLGGVLPLVQARKLRLLAVSSPQRSRYVPDIPTFREAGFPELESVTWYGLFAPARTPEARVQALYDAAAAAFRLPDVRETLGRGAMEPTTMPPQQFAAFLRTEIDRWAPIVKSAGYTAED